MLSRRDKLALLHVTGLIDETAPSTIEAYQYADDKIAERGGKPEPVVGSPASIELVLLNGPGPFPIDDSIPAQFKAILRDDNGIGVPNHPITFGKVDPDPLPGAESVRALSVSQGETDANGEITIELTCLGVSGAITVDANYFIGPGIGNYNDKVTVNFS